MVEETSLDCSKEEIWVLYFEMKENEKVWEPWDSQNLDAKTQ